MVTAVPGSLPLTSPIDHHALMLLGTSPVAFNRPGWGWEIKYDGFRVLAFREGKTARLMSRNGRNLSHAFPEVVEALRAFDRDVVLDGELTVPDPDGRPDFFLLRPRALMSDPLRIRESVRRSPAVLYLFDLLALDNFDVRLTQLIVRRAALAEVMPEAPALSLVKLADDGPGVMRAVLAHRLEGIVGKQLDSPYIAGRNRYWLKVRSPTARPQTRR